MKKAGPIIGLIIALAVALIAFLNQSTVTLDLWLQQVSLPLWALLAGTFLLGLLAGALFMMPLLGRRKDRVHDLEDELEKTKRERDSIAEETRKESEADLTQKNSEINGLLARIDSLETEVRERIRNTQTAPVQSDAAVATDYDNTPNGGNASMPSRKERRANKRDADTTQNNVDYPESPENNMNRDDVRDTASPRTDHKTFDRREDSPADTTDRRDHKTFDRREDHAPEDTGNRTDNRTSGSDSADADLVVKEIDDTDNKRR